MVADTWHVGQIHLGCVSFILVWNARLNITEYQLVHLA